MEIASRLNEKVLLALLENSCESICLLDEDLKPFYRSPSSYQMTGYTLHDRQQHSFVNDTHPDDLEKLQQALKEAKANPRKPIFVAIRFKHKKGHYIVLEVIYTNFLNDENLQAIVCNMRDITERAQMEKILQRKIKQISDYKYALDQSSIVAVTDPQGIIRFANDNFCKISKYSKEELKGQDQRTIISECHSESFIKDIWKTVAAGNVWKGEIKDKAKDGTYYWTHTTIVPFLDEKGKPLQYMAIRADITKKKLAEEEVIRNEKLFRSLIEKNADMMTLILPDGKLKYVSPSLTNVLGYTESEYTNRSAFEFIHPEDLTDLMEQTMGILDSPGNSFYKQQRLLHKDGTYRWCEGTMTNMLLDPDIGALVSNFRDITERKKAEEKLSKALIRLTQAQETANVGSWELNFETGEATWSDKACKIYGIKIEVHSFETWISFIHPEDLTRVKIEMEKSRATLRDSSFEHRILLKDGTVKHIHSTSKFEFNTEGRPTGLIGICHDITERVKSAENLVKSEANLTAIIENADAHIYSIDRDFRYITFNSFLATTMKQKHGLEIKQGDTVFEFLKSAEPKEAEFYENVYKEALKGEVIHFEKKFKIGDFVSYSKFSINPIWGNNGVIGLSCFVRNITQEKQAEQILIEAEIQTKKFARHLNKIQEEERAHLAREIHDELGQQLVGIKMGLSALLKPETEKSVREMITEVDGTIQSLRKIATDLRPGILDSLGLIPSIQWLGTEFEKKTGIKCKIELRIQEQKFEKNISTTYFRICQEALTNISKHAGASEVVIEIKHHKNSLVLKISDDGKGIDKKKLSDPFSMGIIGMRERANLIEGELQIESEKNKGTTICLTAKIN